MDTLQELRPVNTCRRLMDGGWGNVPGDDGGRAIRSWVAAPAREDWQGGRFDDSHGGGRRRRRCGRRGGLSRADAVLALLMATGRSHGDDLFSPRRMRCEH